MAISVIIPAYNEAKRIEPTLVQIMHYLKTHGDAYEIIIVDDCSTDATQKIVSRYCNNHIRIVQNKINRGKGFSVKKGILYAKYPLILFSDSDLATPIEELKQLMVQINKGNDIAIASRNLEGSMITQQQQFYRRILGKIFPFFVNIIALRGFKDTQCGFKLFRADVAKRIALLQTFERFSFDVEMLFIAQKLGCKIAEVPVTWQNKEGSTVNPVKDGFLMLIDLFRLRWNNILGKYTITYGEQKFGSPTPFKSVPFEVRYRAVLENMG